MILGSTLNFYTYAVYLCVWILNTQKLGPGLEAGLKALLLGTAGFAVHSF